MVIFLQNFNIQLEKNLLFNLQGKKHDDIDLPGFPSLDNVGGSENTETIKGKSKSKKSGGFQSMGLSFGVIKGITKRGYKIPTPIQRKVNY